MGLSDDGPKSDSVGERDTANGPGQGAHRYREQSHLPEILYRMKTGPGYDDSRSNGRGKNARSIRISSRDWRIVYGIYGGLSGPGRTQKALQEALYVMGLLHLFALNAEDHVS